MILRDFWKNDHLLFQKVLSPNWATHSCEKILALVLFFLFSGTNRDRRHTCEMNQLRFVDTEVIRSNSLRADHRATDTRSDHTSPNRDFVVPEAGAAYDPRATSLNRKFRPNLRAIRQPAVGGLMEVHGKVAVITGAGGGGQGRLSQGGLRARVRRWSSLTSTRAVDAKPCA